MRALWTWGRSLLSHQIEDMNKHNRDGDGADEARIKHSRSYCAVAGYEIYRRLTPNRHISRSISTVKNAHQNKLLRIRQTAHIEEIIIMRCIPNSQSQALPAMYIMLYIKCHKHVKGKKSYSQILVIATLCHRVG